MVEKFYLALEARDTTKKPNQLRRAGKVPATLYGPGVPSSSFQFDAKEFSRLPAAAYSHIIDLKSPEGNVQALIRQVQREHVSNNVLNVEFYRVAADRKITVTVPLKVVGVSPAIQLGGMMMTNYDQAEVECFPGDIPDNIPVDISMITELDTGIHFSELKIPDKIKVLNPPDEVVVRIVSPKAEKEEEAKPEAGAEPAAAAPAAAAT